MTTMATNNGIFDCPYCTAKGVSGRFCPECRRVPDPCHMKQAAIERAFDEMEKKVERIAKHYLETGGPLLPCNSDSPLGQLERMERCRKNPT